MHKLLINNKNQYFALIFLLFTHKESVSSEKYYILDSFKHLHFDHTIKNFRNNFPKALLKELDAAGIDARYLKPALENAKNIDEFLNGLTYLFPNASDDDLLNAKQFLKNEYERYSKNQLM